MLLIHLSLGWYIGGIALIMTMLALVLIWVGKRSNQEMEEIIRESNPGRNGKLVRLDDYENALGGEFTEIPGVQKN